LWIWVRPRADPAYRSAASDRLCGKLRLLEVCGLSPIYVAKRTRASPAGLAAGTEWVSPSFFHWTQEAAMDWNRVEGNWKQMKGAVKQQWGKLTDDDLTQINGNQEKLEGIIQERYGIAKDETRKQLDSWYQNQNWE
jgi:uncharacterized protein YjbJ (UPF0337 family)